MSTPNFKTQRDFDLYVIDNFVVYPYESDENDDFVLDCNGNPIINYDTNPFFDHSYFNECKNYTDYNLNSKLSFLTSTSSPRFFPRRNALKSIICAWRDISSMILLLRLK